MRRVRVTVVAVPKQEELPLGKTEGTRPLGIPRRRWENNNKIDLQEVRFGCMDWIELAQDRDSWWTFVTAAISLRVP